MSHLSCRDFGKKVSVGALAGVAASSAAHLAMGQGTPSPNPKRMTVLREMVKKPGIIDMAGAYDPISARTAEWVGLPCIATGGYSVGASLCVPEPILSLEDLAEVTRRMTAAVNCPHSRRCRRRLWRARPVLFFFCARAACPMVTQPPPFGLPTFQGLAVGIDCLGHPPSSLPFSGALLKPRVGVGITIAHDPPPRIRTSGFPASGSCLR
jgi:Phosphoenolpyruvate phosphomutase